jgi:hypothetical protein
MWDTAAAAPALRSIEVLPHRAGKELAGQTTEHAAESF